jgi:hypothetical protein|nr:MAG TPA: hypothetical protein [Caudoviricetes sp.]
MIKVEIDVNVRGLDFLKDFIGAGVGPGISEDNGPVWTTNEVPKEEIPQPPVQPIVQPTVQPPVQPTQTVTAPVSEVAYTFDQLTKAAIGLVQSGKIKSTDLTPVLVNGFGVNQMSDLKPEQYNDFAVKLKELGGVI